MEQVAQHILYARQNSATSTPNARSRQSVTLCRRDPVGATYTANCYCAHSTLQEPTPGTILWWGGDPHFQQGWIDNPTISPIRVPVLPLHMRSGSAGSATDDKRHPRLANRH